MPFVVDIRGLEAIVDRLRRIERPDYRTAFPRIGQALVELVEEEFEQERDPYGEPWEPLAPSTLARRRKKGRGARILQDTGVMRRSLNWYAGAHYVAVGFADKKAVWHQQGTPHIPRRALLPWKMRGGTLDVPDTWMRTIMSELEGAFGFGEEE